MIDLVTLALAKNYTDEAIAGGGGAPIIIHAISHTDKYGYVVPVLTDDDIVRAYNGVVAGNNVFVVDDLDTITIQVLDASSIDEVSVRLLFTNVLILTYKIGGEIIATPIGGGGNVPIDEKTIVLDEEGKMSTAIGGWAEGEDEFLTIVDGEFEDVGGAYGDYERALDHEFAMEDYPEDLPCKIKLSFFDNNRAELYEFEGFTTLIRGEVSLGGTVEGIGYSAVDFYPDNHSRDIRVGIYFSSSRTGTGTFAAIDLPRYCSNVKMICSICTKQARVEKIESTVLPIDNQSLCLDTDGLLKTSIGGGEFTSVEVPQLIANGVPTKIEALGQIGYYVPLIAMPDPKYIDDQTWRATLIGGLNIVAQHLITGTEMKLGDIFAFERLAQEVDLWYGEFRRFGINLTMVIVPPDAVLPPEYPLPPNSFLVIGDDLDFDVTYLSLKMPSKLPQKTIEKINPAFLPINNETLQISNGEITTIIGGRL